MNNQITIKQQIKEIKMKRGTIYIPENFTVEEKNFAINFLKKEIEKNPIIASDFIAIYQINDETKIKVFIREEIEKLAKEFKLSIDDVMMGIMRRQNGK